jgi:CRP/FNR family transcriptional regulator, cyclic AMP receptor protein
MPAVDHVGFSECVATLVREHWLSSTLIQIEANTHLYNLGDRDDHIFLLEAGQVKTFTVTSDGRECLLSLYGPGDVFGELCVLETGRTEAASAMRTTTVLRMSLHELLRVLARRGMLEGFIRYEARRIAEQQELITSFVTMNSERRLAARILHLARHLGTKGPSGLRIEERITQEEFASMVGTTRSRVGFFLKRFADAGLVRRTSESFLVVEEERLAAYVRSGAPVCLNGLPARPLRTPRAHPLPSAKSAA